MKKGMSTRRCCCVNLQNETTIEFRIFRGTLRYNTFIATLQLADKICETALSLSNEEMRSLACESETRGIGKEGCKAKYPDLKRYVEKRPNGCYNDHGRFVWILNSEAGDARTENARE